MSTRWILVAALALAVAGCKGLPIAPGPSLDDLLEVSFQGAKARSKEALREVVLEELTAEPDPEVTKAKVDDAAYALELFYRDLGYPDVEVRYDFEPVDGGRPRAHFKVTEGPLVSIRELDVEGAKRLSSEELASLLGEVRVSALFVRSRLEGAVAALRSFYLEDGFLAVQIATPEVDRIAPEAVRVSLRVDEGPRYVLRSVAIEGAVPELAEELEQLAAGARGEPYVPHLAYQLRAGVLRVHGNAGYPDCAVEIKTEKDDPSGDVTLALQAEPGPRVQIIGVEVRGNEEVPAGRVKARIELGPGDVYDAARLNRSFNLLYATGLFDVVRFELEGEGAERTLVVEVEESASLQVFVEPGYGSYEGPRVRMGIRENNLLSSGRRGSLEGWFSELAQGLELQVADPFLFGSAVTGQIAFFASDREEPSFTVDEVGTGLSFRRPWNEQVSTTIGYEYKSTRLSDVTVSGALPPALADSVDIGEVSFAASYDTRDNVLVPKRGGLVRFHSDLAIEALGSGLESFENGLDLTAVLPVDDDTLVAASARFALIAPYGDTDVIPLQRRLFNGGENTVRSFRESELGPVDTKNKPLGGEARTVLSVELRQRLHGNVSGALFYDLGNVELDYMDFLQFNDFRHGIGAGLRYLLPIGPLRLDAAWNPDHKDRESEWVIHFAVGLPF